MNIIKKIFKYLPIAISIILSLYLIICYTVIDFSFSIFTVFLIMILLNIALFYINIHPINNHKEEPKFLYIFIEICYITFFSFIIYTLLYNIFSTKYVLPKDQNFHYMIVFGAGVNIDDDKNYIINKRIEKAIEYAKKNKDIKFVLSGSKAGNDLIEEATYMRNYMIRAGISESKILIDLLSNNTNDNIVNSLYIIQQDVLKRNTYENLVDRPFDTKKDRYDLDLINIGFISNDFHICRINLMAKKRGVFKPYDVPVKTKPFFCFYYYIRECLALYKAFALGQL